VNFHEMPEPQLSKPTIFRALAAGVLVIGSKAAAVLKSSGSAVKIVALLGSAGTAAAALQPGTDKVDATDFVSPRS